MKLRRVNARSRFITVSLLGGFKDGVPKKNFVALILKKDASARRENVVDLVHGETIHLDIDAVRQANDLDLGPSSDREPQ